MRCACASAVLLAACYAPAVPSEVPCGEGDACPGAQVCDHGRPVPTCVDQLGDAGTIGDDGNQATIDAPTDADPMPLPSDNVMRLRFDDDPTDGVLDALGTHTATCTGATCPAQTTGHLGGAYAFTDDHIDVTDAADLRPNQAFTVAAWIEFEGPSGHEMMILCKHYFTIAQSYGLSLTGNNNARLRFIGPNSTYTGAMIVSPDAWHHVAVTWDGSLARLYLDGEANGSSMQPTLPGDTGIVQIGACHGEKTFVGTIDDGQFYSRALTATEIATLASY